MITDLSRIGVAASRVARMFGDGKRTDAADGVLIGTTRRDEAVVFPAPSAEHASHALVLAASGAGKTVLVANALISEIMAASKAEAERQQATVIIDPKGDLVSAVLSGLCFFAPEKLADIAYLNLFSIGAFSFNLRLLARGNTPVDIMAMQLANLVSVVSTATGSQAHLGTGARQVDTLQNLLLGTLDSARSDGSVLWALDALAEPKGLKLLAGLTVSTRARQFLSTAMLSDELRASCASRLRAAFGATEQLERIVSAPCCLQFADILAPGRLVLIDLGTPPGGLQSLQSFWANLIVRLLVEAIMERPSPFSGHHCRLVIDEAQIVAPVLADCAERILTTGRSRCVSLVVLSQGTTLLNEASGTLLRVILTNTNFKIIGRLAAADAQLLARESTPKLGIDESASATRERFCTSVCNLPDREFYVMTPGGRDRFTSTSVDLPAWQQAAEKHATEIQAVKTRLALPETTAPRLTLKQAAEQTNKAQKTPPASSPATSQARARWG